MSVPPVNALSGSVNAAPCARVARSTLVIVGIVLIPDVTRAGPVYPSVRAMSINDEVVRGTPPLTPASIAAIPAAEEVS